MIASIIAATRFVTTFPSVSPGHESTVATMVIGCQEGAERSD
jgi:hypothetical protein